jgi:hypothetical protein
MNLRLIASGKVLPFTVVQEVRQQVTGAGQKENSVKFTARKGEGFLNPQGNLRKKREVGIE